MDIGEQKRVIQVEPEPLRAPDRPVEPGPLVVPEPQREAEPVAVPVR